MSSLGVADYDGTLELSAFESPPLSLDGRANTGHATATHASRNTRLRQGSRSLLPQADPAVGATHASQWPSGGRSHQARTINYRHLKASMDGCFCEKIFDLSKRTGNAIAASTSGCGTGGILSRERLRPLMVTEAGVRRTAWDSSSWRPAGPMFWVSSSGIPAMWRFLLDMRCGCWSRSFYFNAILWA